MDQLVRHVHTSIHVPRYLVHTCVLTPSMTAPSFLMPVVPRRPRGQFDWVGVRRNVYICFNGVCAHFATRSGLLSTCSSLKNRWDQHLIPMTLTGSGMEQMELTVARQVCEAEQGCGRRRRRREQQPHVRAQESYVRRRRKADIAMKRKESGRAHRS